MPYEVLKDGVTVPKALSELKDNSGNVHGYDHRSKIYRKGEIIADEDVSPVIKEALENDDPHTTSVLKETSEDPNVAGPEGGSVDVPDVTMGPETASPGVIKPAEAAEMLEMQTAAGEADQPLAAGLSDEGKEKLEEEGFEATTAMGRVPAVVSEQTPAEAEASAKEAEAEAKETAKAASAEGESKSSKK